MIPFNLFSGLMAKIYSAVALLAVAGLFVQTVRIEGVWFVKGYAERLANSEAREGQLIAASERNAKEQARIFTENTAKQTQIERLNRETSKLQAIAIRDASSRYAADNRLHKICPNVSGTDPAAKDSAAQWNDGLQAGAILLSAADFELLNARTADAIRYEDWARALIAEGVAVEAE